MSNRHLVPAVTLLCVGAAAFSVSCGGGSKGSEATVVTTTTTTTLPNTSAQYACTLGNGTEETDCDRAAPRLYEPVRAAIARLIAEKPQAVDVSDEAYPPGSGSYKVLDRDVFLDGVVTNLLRAGLCAQRDPDDYNYERILVKSDNASSEAYDIVLGSGYIRSNESAYRLTCTPAAFPVPRTEQVPPANSGCGRPYPVVTRMRVHMHFQGNDIEVLDATPLVGPDQMYCASIGYTDSRSMCPVRVEGSPERKPCEDWQMGEAEDTHRLGPTWTNERGEYCTGPASGCENHPDSQYALIVYTAGTYTACGRTGACGSYAVE